MSNTWMAQPRSFPHKCFMCNRSAPENGPYFEVNGPIYIYPGTGNPARMYWCRECFRVPANADPTVFREITEEQDNGEIERLRGEIVQLRRELQDDPAYAVAERIEAAFKQRWRDASQAKRQQRQAAK